MTVSFSNTPTWLQYLIAFGTVGAAIFAGAAAIAAWRSATATQESTKVATRATRAAQRSANAARKLIAIENNRDEHDAKELQMRHARRVVLQLGIEPITASHGRRGFDVQALVHNAGDDPIRHCRLRIDAGGTVWGPQYLGHLGGREEGGLMVRIYSECDIDAVKAVCAFVDVAGVRWQVDERSRLSVDDVSPEQWRADAVEFAMRHGRTVLERGSTLGAFQQRYPNFEEWRRQELQEP